MTPLKVNPYEVFQIRRVEHCPPYFETTTFEIKFRANMTGIVEWIDSNLKGRYYIGESVSIDDDSPIKIKTKIGFEDRKDMSYFLIACPNL